MNQAASWHTLRYFTMVYTRARFDPRAHLRPISAMLERLQTVEAGRVLPAVELVVDLDALQALLRQ